MIAASAALVAAAHTTALAQEGQARPQDGFTAGTVMRDMSEADRYVFVAGIIEGLAHARYVVDNRETTGRDCIFNWFYREPRAINAIHAGFERYPNSLPGQVVGALANNACGGS